MKIGLVAEYNPLHKGHLYQINKIKEMYPDGKIIVCMSSNFVQRGEPAIINKFQRAKLAIDLGVDLVFELPVYFSTQNAEIFAKASINILNNLKVEKIIFGSEDKIETLKNILEKIENNKDIYRENLKENLKKGYSYQKSSLIAMDFLNKIEKDALKKANNILGLEYLKAIKKINPEISAQTIKRVGVDHNSQDSTLEFASASLIRKKIFQNKSVKNFLPLETYESIKKQKLNNLENYYHIFKHQILLDSSLKDYMDYEIGMENLFLKNLDAKNFSEFINSCTNKRYSSSRIKRLILSKILDLKKEDIKNYLYLPYLRLLAGNSKGFEILKDLEYPIITNKKNLKNFSPEIKAIYEKEVFATNVYNTFSTGKLNEDYTRKIFIKK